MDPLASRLLKLVESLKTDEAIKQSLINTINSQGITEIVLTEVRQIIDRTIADYQKETERQVEQLDQELEAIEANYKTQVAQLRLEEDRLGLDEIRKKIHDV